MECFQGDAEGGGDRVPRGTQQQVTIREFGIKWVGECNTKIRGSREWTKKYNSITKNNNKRQIRDRQLVL